jgi:cell division septal protein FtsQ
MRLRPLLRKFRSEIVSWVRGAFLTAAVFGGGAWVLHTAYFRVWPAIVNHPYFHLAAVRVRCDTDAVGPEKIAARAGLYAGTSLWELDTTAAEQALEEPRWVRAAHVRKRFPDRVVVEVEERKPVAATPTAGGLFLIDETGVIFRPEGRREYPDVPYLTGWQAGGDEAERALRLRRLLRIARVAEEAGIDVSQVDVDGSEVYWLFPERRRVSVRLGEAGEAERKLPRLRAALAKLPEAGVAVTEIDASYSDRLVLRTWKGGYSILTAELAATGRTSSSLARAKTTTVRGEGDRG